MANEYFESYQIDAKTMKKMQNKMLEMLLYFQEFCEKYKLMFYLCGGACIGAIREHGFVPWDDDIDVFMPREDYEKFAQLWDKYGDKDRYVYCRTNEKVNYHHTACSLRDPNTTFICKYNQNSDICHGIAFEIGPLDGAPSNKIRRWIQLLNSFMYCLFNAQRLPNNKGRFFRYMAGVIYLLIPSKKIRYRLWKHAEKEMSKYSWDECEYVTELSGGSIKGTLNMNPKEWFSSAIYVDFCGYQVPVMAGYDQYLRKVFGNYMTRPPKSEQVAKHNLEFIDMDNPYIKYKNIKYFPGKKGKVGGAM